MLESPIQQLPTDVIVGSAIIRKCVKGTTTLRVVYGDAERRSTNDHPPIHEWHLSSVKRLKRPRKVAPGRQPSRCRSGRFDVHTNVFFTRLETRKYGIQTAATTTPLMISVAPSG